MYALLVELVLNNALEGDSAFLGAAEDVQVTHPESMLMLVTGHVPHLKVREIDDGIVITWRLQHWIEFVATTSSYIDGMAYFY